MQPYVDATTVASGAATYGDGAESHEPTICTSTDYTTFRIMEFGVKVIPSVLFFILGTLRYLKIRDIG